ncbi:ATP-binding protein [Streptomyces daliensis]
MNGCDSHTVRAALTVPLLAEPCAVRTVRRRVREHVRLWGLPGLADTAELCVSELVTNAIRHVGEGTPVTLHVTWDAERTRIALTDPAPHALPAPLHPHADDESGRGLALIEALALRWGVNVEGAEGKTVWCEVGATS